MTSSQPDDESLVERLLTLSKTQSDAIQHFVNDYGNVRLPVEDERHPAHWPDSRRQQMHRDAETLIKLGAAIEDLMRQLVDRRERLASSQSDL